MSYLQRSFRTIFVVLGYKCNMNCAYCLQHPLITKQVKSEVSEDVINFLRETADNQKDTRLQVHFFGGEPLLYFEQMKKITNSLKDKKNITLSVISNGKAITDEMVDFFNKNDFGVAISWDGSNVLQTRKFDVFEKEDIREKLLRINHLAISSVLSSVCYFDTIFPALEKLDNEYFKIHGYHLRNNVDLIMEHGDEIKWLADVDYKKVSSQIYDMVSKYLELKGSNDGSMGYFEWEYANYLVNRVKTFYIDENAKFRSSYCCCGNGFSTLNIDLEGNLHVCHNVSEVIGNIKDDYFMYLNEVLKHEKLLYHKSICEECPAVCMCHGGCKLLPFEKMQETICKLYKAIVYPTIKLLEEYGEKNG